MSRPKVSLATWSVLAACAVMIAIAAPVRAQERPDSGATHHEMSHDISPPLEAPRLGSITFATSATPGAHAAFVRGMLYLHNFHYPQAAAAFREAQQLDPGDVMSYWGEAVSYTHPVWNQQDTSAARAVLRRLAATPAERLAKARTKRERAWLATAEALYDDDVSKARRDTLWSASLDELRTEYPSDIEAQLIYALSLLGLNEGDRDVPTYLRAYAIARRVFRAHPNHPGAAHYVIHAVDDPAHASLGLDAARAYSRIAPDASHAQHMTSHILHRARHVGRRDRGERARAESAALAGAASVWPRRAVARVRAAAGGAVCGSGGVGRLDACADGSLREEREGRRTTRCSRAARISCSIARRTSPTRARGARRSPRSRSTRRDSAFTISR